MRSRAVDGLATALPDEPDFCDVRAQRIVAVGYLGLLAEAQAQALAQARP